MSKSTTTTKKRPKKPRCLIFWITEEHRKMIEQIAAYRETATAAEAVRHALDHELRRGPTNERLMVAGPFTAQFCMEASDQDRALVESIKSTRYVRTMSDALRLAIEREAYAVRSERTAARAKK